MSIAQKKRASYHPVTLVSHCMLQKTAVNRVFFAVYDTQQVLPGYLIFVCRLLSFLQCVNRGFNLS